MFDECLFDEGYKEELTLNQRKASFIRKKRNLEDKLDRCRKHKEAVQDLLNAFDKYVVDMKGSACLPDMYTVHGRLIVDNQRLSVELEQVAKRIIETDKLIKETE